jgi:hypothetical protein
MAYQQRTLDHYREQLTKLQEQARKLDLDVQVDEKFLTFTLVRGEERLRVGDFYSTEVYMGGYARGLGVGFDKGYASALGLSEGEVVG